VSLDKGMRCHTAHTVPKIILAFKAPTDLQRVNGYPEPAYLFTCRKDKKDKEKDGTIKEEIESQGSTPINLINPYSRTIMAGIKKTIGNTISSF